MSTAAAPTMNETHVTHEFERIFHDYYPFVYRTAYRVTGAAADAEDVVQTVFLRLVRRGLPRGFEENPRGYLYRAAVNEALTTLRSRRRYVATQDFETIQSSHAGSDPASESAGHALLIEAVSKLSPHLVEMLVLRYEHDYSDAEIAKLLGKSRGVVAVTLYRARARLKKLMRASLGGKS
jgi:RNA polymerase sigma-70 factor, ECF subfamily